MNAVLLLQAFQSGGIFGVVGFVVSYGYQSVQHTNCVENLPPLILDMGNLGQQVVESVTRKAAACPGPDATSALGTAALVGFAATVITALVKQNKN